MPYSKYTITDIINQVLAFCGIPPMADASSYRTLLTSDAGMVHQILQRIHNTELFEGWWFNTLREVEVPSGISFYQVVALKDVINAVPAQVSKCDGVAMEFWKPYESAQGYIETVSGQDTEHDSTVDVMIYEELEDCPAVYVDFVVKMAAEEFSTVIGQTFNRDLVPIAERKLRMEAKKHNKKRNVFRST